jgi:purine-binding chemotaxis protein CheW
MDTLQLLIFKLDGILFGLDAVAVQETIWLPELEPAVGAPAWVVGLFDLRGRIMPVVDLGRYFGHATCAGGRDRQIVVLWSDRQPVGLIVEEVLDVIDMPRAALQPPVLAAATPLVIGEVSAGDRLVAVLDMDRLAAFSVEMANAGYTPGCMGRPMEEVETDETRAVLHQRALALKHAAEEEDDSRTGFAVVRIQDEYFGLALADIQEFCEIANLCPVPCCPPHILGVINLRGELICLIDPRHALSLTSAAKGNQQAVIVGRETQCLGIAVDAVDDVVYLGKDALQAPSALLCERGGSDILGTVPYAGRLMTVLDVPALLAREEWIVNESV